MDFAEAQKLVWENKVSKGFNKDVAVEFGLLTAEVSEAFLAWRRDLPDLGGELADIVIYALGLAELNGLNLAEEVRRKIAKNHARVYVPGHNGVLLEAKE